FHVTRRVFTAATAHVAETFRSGHMLGNIAPTTIDMAAATEAAGAVRVFKFDGVVIEDFAVVRTFAHLDTAHALGADGVALLDPIDHVEIVNVLFTDVIAAEPDKVIPVAHLIFHLGDFSSVLFLEFGARVNPRGGAVPVAAHGGNVANRAFLEPFDGFEIAQLMVTLETHAHLEVLLFRFFGRREDAAHAGRIGRHR